MFSKRCLMIICFLGCLSQGFSFASKNTYLDLNLGLANHQSKDKMTALIDQVTNNEANKTSLFHFNYAWTIGGDIGYELNHFFGVEGGGMVFQDRTIRANENIPHDDPLLNTNDQLQMRSWLTYLVMKAKTPIMRMVDMYAKVGAGYEQQNVNGQNTQASDAINDALGNNHRWTPVLSLGLEDTLNRSIHLKLQYMYVPAHWDILKASPTNDATHFNPKHIYTLSLGYYFSL